jgi:large subunit ribosomal protein L30
VTKFRITLVKSSIGYSSDQRRTLQTLGLRRIRQSVVREDSLALRGQIMKIKHLVMIEEEANATE